MPTYMPPVDSLLTRGELEYDREWDNYLALGFSEADVSELIRMVTDPELCSLESEGSEIWARNHAWRALGQLQAESAIEPLVGLLRENVDWYNDDDLNEIPRVLGMIGPAAIAPLERALESRTHGEYGTVALTSALKEIGAANPAVRDQCVGLIMAQLRSYKEQAEHWNAFVIEDLVALKAKEAAPLIEEVFAADLVDENITGDWREVWSELGLEGDPPPHSDHWHAREAAREEWEELRRSNFAPQFSVVRDPTPAPAARPARIQPPPRPPEERKARNKARQKLEKRASSKQRKK